MSFADIFKASFLSEYSVTISTTSICVYLSVAAALGFYIYVIYRLITKKSFYSKSFNISLWVLTVITAAIIITISSNIVLSLGMVGALSIVRYRTAIKDPMDLIFLFWAIAEGIMTGAGMAIMGMVLAVVITVGIVILDKLPMPGASKIMTISANDYNSEGEILQIVSSYCKYYKLKARTLSAGQLNLVLEFNTTDEIGCTKELLAIDGVYSVSTLAHDGEVTF